jgi:hypothetical protein
MCSGDGSTLLGPYYATASRLRSQSRTVRYHTVTTKTVSSADLPSIRLSIFDAHGKFATSPQKTDVSTSATRCRCHTGSFVVAVAAFSIATSPRRKWCCQERASCPSDFPAGADHQYTSRSHSIHYGHFCSKAPAPCHRRRIARAAVGTMVGRTGRLDALVRNAVPLGSGRIHDVFDPICGKQWQARPRCAACP